MYQGAMPVEFFYLSHDVAAGFCLRRFGIGQPLSPVAQEFLPHQTQFFDRSPLGLASKDKAKPCSAASASGLATIAFW